MTNISICSLSWIHELSNEESLMTIPYHSYSGGNIYTVYIISIDEWIERAALLLSCQVFSLFISFLLLNYQLIQILDWLRGATHTGK